MNEIILSNDLNVITAEINSYKQVAGQSIFEIGKRLKHVKENDLVHGEFGSWLESIDMNDSYARKFIKVFDELKENRSTLNVLGMSALYEIATLPEEEREKEHEVNGETKNVDEMTVRELQEVKRKLKEKDRQLEQAKNSNEITQRKLEALEDREPEVIEKVIVDETEINKLETTLERYEDKIDLLEEQIKNNKINLEEFNIIKNQINSLYTEKDDVIRQIESAGTIGKFIARVEKSFQQDLAPIKYTRALREAADNESVVNAVNDILEMVEDWVIEMRKEVKTNNYVEVIDHE